MHSYPSSGSSLPSQLTGPSNYPSNLVNMSLAPQNRPFQQAHPGPVTTSVVQGTQAAHHHHHHLYPQVGFEQMRRYSLAIHDQAHAYSLWYQQMNAMHGFLIPQPYQFQPLSLPAPPMNPLYHQKQFAKDNKTDREEIEKLAPIVGLTPAQIRHWFSNERAKVRKYGEKKKEDEEKKKVEVVVKKEIIVVKIERDSD
ncbi:hypothetical protein B9Z55_012653 [Caenorhabditis nigoni]|uniref:Homeobox domain-containing protein n=1 Tax=Caenorhabditis nigoni TaxID=1611254 RepID=A0A2G5TY64_9PELO|nr:hypothetical protein B9Z55_012653 [Caenorhabditis nigoni]